MSRFHHEALAMGLRVPPHSTEAEQAVLGGLMLAPGRIDAVASHLNATDFYRRDHQIIYQAMVTLAQRGQPCDAITLGEWFERNGFVDVDAAYLIEVANATPSAANIAAYAQIVHGHSTRRRVIDAATQLTERAFALGDEPADLLDSGIAELMGMQRVEQGSEYTLRQALTLAFDAAMAAQARGGKIPGIPTGLSDLDDVLGGLHDSDLVIIGARPAMGKTALLLNFALGDDSPAGLISAEQPAVQIGSRLLSIEGGVNASRLRNGSHDEEDLGRMSNAVGRLLAPEAPRELMVFDRAAPTIAEVMRTARRWKQQYGIRRLLVDYVQRIKGTNPKDSRIDQVGEVAQGLKGIARELNIPVVALAQVNRKVEERSDKRPGMGDLANSSELEKEADQILMLYRDEVYNPESPDKGIAEINVEKNRHGPTGFVRAVWRPETMQFRDMVRGGDDW
ncbi:MAG: Replicative DNA helicase [Luteibacter sp.]|uniref:replicative DNA helicase n=1 Tax=Luteibacter sp. TaxID=1886636 RepID=UPI00137E3B5C|nr:replicative DNA helicase [Luteibacter sp.]KAF1005453.1 MAG: Replicative DNA helicase [Luteibacter sp.]